MNHQRWNRKLLGKTITHGPGRDIGFHPALLLNDFAVGRFRGSEHWDRWEQHREREALAIAQQLRPVRMKLQLAKPFGPHDFLGVDPKRCGSKTAG